MTEPTPVLHGPDVTANLSGPVCRVRNSDGYLCTRITDHDGQHAAGTGRRIIAVWPTEPALAARELTALRQLADDVRSILDAGCGDACPCGALTAAYDRYNEYRSGLDRPSETYEREPEPDGPSRRGTIRHGGVTDAGTVEPEHPWTAGTVEPEHPWTAGTVEPEHPWTVLPDGSVDFSALRGDDTDDPTEPVKSEDRNSLAEHRMHTDTPGASCAPTCPFYTEPLPDPARAGIDYTTREQRGEQGWSVA